MEPSELVTDSSNAMCTQHAACKAPTPCLPTYRICSPPLCLLFQPLTDHCFEKLLSSLPLSPLLAPPTFSAGLFFLQLSGDPFTFCPSLTSPGPHSVLLYTPSALKGGGGTRWAFQSPVKRSVCQPGGPLPISLIVSYWISMQTQARLLKQLREGD